MRLADGTPIEAGQIEFQAVDKDVSSVGFIGPDGRFTLSSVGRHDGAYAGEYRVAIKPPPIPVMVPGQEDVSDAEIAVRQKWLETVPERYLNPQTSGITVAIDDDTDSLEIVIRPEDSGA